MRSRQRLGALVLVLAVAVACHPAEPAKEYTLKGQVLAVERSRNEITIKHEDIPNFMPAMTMSYPVTRPELMEGRVAGEIITATLEVRDATGRLSAITHVGAAPIESTANAVAMAAAPLTVGDDVPDVALIDQTNRRRSLSDWRGSLTLLTFIYTSCPDPTFCPLMDQNFSTIQRAVAKDPTLAKAVKLISISFDPERDTPAVLSAHAAKRHADPAVWTFLTGDAVSVDRIAGRFGVGVIRPNHPGEINHTLRTVLVSGAGRVLKIYAGNSWTPGSVLADLRAALPSQ